MDALRVYSLLQDACRLLEDAGDHAISAYVGQAMSLVRDKYAVGDDHLDTFDYD